MQQIMVLVLAQLAFCQICAPGKAISKRIVTVSMGTGWGFATIDSDGGWSSGGGGTVHHGKQALALGEHQVLLDNNGTVWKAARGGPVQSIATGGVHKIASNDCALVALWPNRTMRVWGDPATCSDPLASQTGAQPDTVDGAQHVHLTRRSVVAIVGRGTNDSSTVVWSTGPLSVWPQQYPGGVTLSGNHFGVVIATTGNNIVNNNLSTVFTDDPRCTAKAVPPDWQREGAESQIASAMVACYGAQLAAGGAYATINHTYGTLIHYSNSGVLFYPRAGEATPLFPPGYENWNVSRIAASDTGFALQLAGRGGVVGVPVWVVPKQLQHADVRVVQLTLDGNRGVVVLANRSAMVWAVPTVAGGQPAVLGWWRGVSRVYLGKKNDLIVVQSEVGGLAVAGGIVNGGGYIYTPDCTPCDEGAFSASVDSTRCDACPAGYWSTKASVKCTPCTFRVCDKVLVALFTLGALSFLLCFCCFKQCRKTKQELLLED